MGAVSAIRPVGVVFRQSCKQKITMATISVLFYIFSAVLLFAALRVITARNTVHSALFLILSFFSASCLWMLLSAEFLAISLVLVYVGAVMVLFLFVVMMLDTNLENIRRGFWRHFPLAAFVGVVIALEMAAVLLPGFRVSEVLPEDPVALKMGNTKLLGIEIYTHYLYPLEIAAVVLLVAMIAAIALTLRSRKDSKYTNPAEQVKARKAERVRIVKMSPQVEKKTEPLVDQGTKNGGLT
jgi:NADH-quinone oxidoreductase subunit J